LSQLSSLSKLSQPRTGSQVSSVQATPSSQSRAVPPAQIPPEQTSAPLHTSPSSQSSSMPQVLPGSQPSGSVPTAAAHTSPARQAP